MTSSDFTGSPSAGIGPISALIPAVARTHRALAAELLREIGLYPGQELLLMVLWHQDGRSQNDVARALLVEPPTAAKMVRRLTETGFVRTERSTADARKIVVSLTEAGRAVRPRVEAIWAELEARTVAGLSEPERRQLHTLLGRVGTGLSEPS